MALDLKPQHEAPPADQEQAVRARKLTSVEPTAGAPAPLNIPWSYGETRVTAMVVDPDRLFVYFEVTDAAVDRARKTLGAGGARAWLNLRVYDTTARIFDGTNAHSYFDRGIDRADRDHFFDIRKPGSEAFVEIGLLSDEGYFAKIARSGKAVFPRGAPAPWTDPEWMTVRVATGEIVHTARVAPAGGGGAASGAGAPPRSASDDAGAERRDGPPAWRVAVSWEEVFPGGEWSELHSWEELVREGISETLRTMSWDGETLVSSWETGPFAYPVEVIAPTSESFVGSVRRYRVGERTHIVHGPWEVVIRGLGAHAGRKIVGRWEVHRRWTVSGPSGARRVALVSSTATGGASERVLAGASEWRWIGASEERLGGASELFYVGASERRFPGASELSYQGSSELRMRGASERRFRGASERRLGGASEQRLGGASEQRLGGASEQRLGGASEQRPGGAEDGRYPSPPTERR